MLKLKTILKEDEVTDKFGNVAFGENPKIAKFQGKREEKNTELENKLLNLLAMWTTGDRISYAANNLYKNLNLFKKAAKKFPKIFLPKTKNGTTLYRGLNNPGAELMSQLENAKPKNWKKLQLTSSPNSVVWLYTKPIEYKPRRKVQSWTDDPSVAFGKFFGGELGVSLMTKQNDEFLFNKNFLGSTSLYDFSEGPEGAPESEVLHFGQTYSEDVFLVVRANVKFGYDTIKSINAALKGETKPKTKEEVKAILKKLSIPSKKYTINQDLTVDVKGTVLLRGMALKTIPVNFGVVTGHFACDTNQLTSLDGAPKEVGGNFYCHDNAKQFTRTYVKSISNVSGKILVK